MLLAGRTDLRPPSTASICVMLVCGWSYALSRPATAGRTSLRFRRPSVHSHLRRSPDRGPASQPYLRPIGEPLPAVRPLHVLTQVLTRNSRRCNGGSWCYHTRARHCLHSGCARPPPLTKASLMARPQTKEPSTWWLSRCLMSVELWYHTTKPDGVSSSPSALAAKQPRAWRPSTSSAWASTLLSSAWPYALSRPATAGVQAFASEGLRHRPLAPSCDLRLVLRASAARRGWSYKPSLSKAFRRSHLRPVAGPLSGAQPNLLPDDEPLPAARPLHASHKYLLATLGAARWPHSGTHLPQASGLQDFSMYREP